MASSKNASSLSDPYKLPMLIFAIIAFMYFSAEVLKPLALSVLLSFALAPAVKFLERRRFNRVFAVVLVGTLTLVSLGGIGYVVGQQLTSLADKLPDYQDNIEAKLSGVLHPGQQSSLDKVTSLANRVTAKMEGAPTTSAAPATVAATAAAEGAEPEAQTPQAIQKVQVVSSPSFQERLREAIGPYLEFLGVGSFVLILVLFMLIGRDDLGDRIIQLFGHRQVTLTTRTSEEISRRITRYLGTFALMNIGFGLVIGLGMAVIGVPYAVLWGCLAALLRFIPYVGPAVAFVLPLVFSFAHFPGWMQPILVVALFGVVETALNSFLEPIIYGKTTGVSALGLLVAAMFWTWLWGTLGLLLSTPLTVCLAVLGKYVPSLSFFATLLGEEAELEPDVRFYQRLVALDQEGAIAFIEEEAKRVPRAEIFDSILVPTLSRAERDAARDELDEKELAFVWRVVGEVLDSLEDTPEFSLAAASAAAPADGKPAEPITVLGLAAEDTADALVLRMLAQLVAPAGFTLELEADVESPLEVVERVADRSPRLVVISHLPPVGLSQARYLVRRLRARFADLPLLVGRWGELGGSATAAERLVGVGATAVLFSLAEARDKIIAMGKGATATPPAEGMGVGLSREPARTTA
ncbi:AI-2E family transporter [Isosphaeraceae bacterium EP7]